MGNENGKINSGTELIRDAKRHYDFIQDLNFSPQLFHRNIVKFAVIRYEQYWLPFVAKHIGKKLIAPLDIELIWVSHMLNPLAYEKDCFTIASRLIPHYVATSEERKYDKMTKELWYSTYPDDLPLDLDLSLIPPDLKPYHSNITSNLINAVNDYRLFCRQVSLPHFRDDKFLETAFQDYVRDAEDGDLRKTTYPYHKGFMWKTHMLKPSAYRRDLKALNDRIVNRVQNMSVRGSMARKASMNHGGSFEDAVDGAMYRGEVTPLQELMSNKQLASICRKMYGLRITAFRLENLEDHRSYIFNINAKALQNNEEEKLLRFDIASKGKIYLKTFDKTSKMNYITFDSNIYDLLHFDVVETSQNRRKGYSALDARFAMDFSFPGNQDYEENEEFKVSFRLPLTDGTQHTQELSGWMKFMCVRADVQVVRLLFSPDVNHMAGHEHYCQVLKYPLMMSPYACKLEEAPCSFLNMIISDSERKCEFKCRILQANLGDFSSIEVYDHRDSLISSSYTVGRESIPTVKQISKPEKCCVLRDNTETVFVTRSTNYDWGLLKVSKSSNDDVALPNKILFMNMKAMSPKWEKLYDSERDVKSIHFKSRQGVLMVDLENVTLTLPPIQKEFPELLSLGVTIITLFCIKRLQKMT